METPVLETIAHYLLVCNIYEIERETLREEVGVQGMRVEKLLGYSKFVVYTLEYVIKTERFDF
jgi:hypothetical protein